MYSEEGTRVHELALRRETIKVREQKRNGRKGRSVNLNHLSTQEDFPMASFTTRSRLSTAVPQSCITAKEPPVMARSLVRKSYHFVDALL
mmetsp:Transcript_52725/g.140670  ORF Transcript_52725/g.140670 Transcript_52725/m.140670 type:complete len:90 (-) Transcript_52725:1326-1595(-)